MIRKYRDNDVDAVVSAWRAAANVAHPFLSAEFMAKEEDNVRNIYVKMAETWVVEVAGHVVGFVALVDTETSWEIGGLFLNPQYHGRGLGQALVDKAYNEKGPLKLEVFKKNQIGRRFYDRYGFQKKEERLHEETGEETYLMVFPAK